MSRALDRARDGDPSIVVVEGEAGIGKTAFVRRCLTYAEDFVVLTASADESERNLD